MHFNDHNNNSGIHSACDTHAGPGCPLWCRRHWKYQKADWSAMKSWNKAACPPKVSTGLGLPLSRGFAKSCNGILSYLCDRKRSA